MITSRLAAVAVMLFAGALRAQNADSALQSAVNADPWPRKSATSSGELTIYQPQLDAWTGNTLTFHAAASFQSNPQAPEMFGVLYGTARTEVDKDARTVTLEDLKITNAKFPAHPDSVPSYLAAMRGAVPLTARTISLDRLQTSLLIVTDQKKMKTVPVKNAPPALYFSTVPAMLVLTDGAPRLVAVPGTSSQRVQNTSVLIAYTGYTYYLRLYDGWMQAVQMTGPWVPAYGAPPVLDSVIAWAQTQRIDLLSGRSSDPSEPAPSLWSGTTPVIYTSAVPAELIVTNGAPDYVPVNGTDLLFVTNTSAYVFEYIDDQQVYVLLAGRWFTAPATSGPWTFVPAAQLPKDFWKIPPDGPAEAVLVSVPGTPQALEAAIENSIPQTGAVALNTTMPAPAIGGAPQLVPIPGTNLQYVANAPVPIIQYAPGAYYAVYNAVWYFAPTALGPWSVTTIVPAAIYTIPPSSPVYYVTYVRVYGATATTVYVGYTPGYYGTVVVSGGVVVYGTGYVYPAYVGAYYYPPPVTYGYGVAVVMVHPYYAPVYYNAAYYDHGYVAGTTGDQYSHYGSTSAMTHTSAAYNPYTGEGASQKYGSSYNAATGVAASGQRTTTGNAYTGNYQSYASGSAYSTKTGASATGYTNTTGNAYTGQQTKTGQAQVTSASGKTTDVSGVQTNNASAVKVNNNVYGDVNGNVYKQNPNNSWSQYNGTSKSSGSSSWGSYGGSKSGASTSSLNSQSWSRSAGQSRSSSYSGSRH
jgi:hypothetical protein